MEKAPTPLLRWWYRNQWKLFWNLTDRIFVARSYDMEKRWNEMLRKIWKLIFRTPRTGKGTRNESKLEEFVGFLEEDNVTPISKGLGHKYWWLAPCLPRKRRKPIARLIVFPLR